MKPILLLASLTLVACSHQPPQWQSLQPRPQPGEKHCFIYSGGSWNNESGRLVLNAPGGCGGLSANCRVTLRFRSGVTILADGGLAAASHRHAD
jgi:hypothetical protein